MINKYEHLPNGITVIYCRKVGEKINEKVFIDSKYFDFVNIEGCEWVIYSNTENRNIPENKQYSVKCSIDGIQRYLKSIIGNIKYGSGNSFALINYDYFDLREDNIYAYPKRRMNGKALQKKREELLPKLEPLLARINKPLTELNEVQIVHYKGGILFIKGNIVVKEVEKEFLDVLKNSNLLANKK